MGVETEDDVAIRSGAVSLLEQDKHSIVEGAEPFGDRSKDLWNTLLIWLDAVEEGRVRLGEHTFLDGHEQGVARRAGERHSGRQRHGSMPGIVSRGIGMRGRKPT